MSKIQRTSSARKRILETAESLFYSEGIRSVGIDRVIAEAGVAKMTLYNHFSSKDELILEVLKYREEQFDQFLKELIERNEAKGMKPLEAFFAALRSWFNQADYRGCSFINAVAELADSHHGASQFCAAHKQRFREMLTDIIIKSEGPKAAAAAPAISVLVEGAIVTSVSEKNANAADIVEEAAKVLIAKAKRG